MKNIIILGSTGSIGRQTLEIVDNNPELKVIALAAGRNSRLMEEQVRKYKPKVVVMWEKSAAEDLQIKLKDLKIKILIGMEGLLEIVRLQETEIVVTAMVGMIGIRPTIEAIKAKKNIALANKETLVTAGHIIMPLAKEYGVKILPVDSEHSAIFQSLNGEKKEEVESIILTASGGPFLGKSKEELRKIQVEDALKHPNWSMGQKITIDSSTLVNKGLEVIEAKWLFDVNIEQIQVVVHPQSIIHSMVRFVDGGVIAQMGLPDMKLPIQYALFYPKRKPMKDNYLDFYELNQLTFLKPDVDKFRGLQLAYDAITIGGSMPTIYNAANEKAVALFLDKKIQYLKIVALIEEMMNTFEVISHPSLDEILEIEGRVYASIEERLNAISIRQE